MREAYVYEAIRTPRGAAKEGGALTSVRSVELVAQLLREMVRRTGSTQHASTI